VGAASPAAGVTEVHEMKMEGDVMKMRAVTGLDLPQARPWSSSPVATTSC
jgi:copper(I)-binding protein